MKILLLGKNGQIGWELQRTLAPLGEIIALGREELDLVNEKAIRSTVRSVKPDFIVNAAAYTAVDKAEEEHDLAMAINGIAPGILAEEAALCKAAIVHYSTDYVFDGNKDIPYTEEDPPNPINIYGSTKLAGERAIQETETPHLIFRTSWVYGLRGKNFLLTILRLAAEKDELKIVDDQIGSPTWCRTVAEITANILTQNSFEKDKQGIYNLTAAGEATWYGFARKIIAHYTNLTNRKVKLKAIATGEYPTPARRPAYSILSCDKLKEQFCSTLPDWDYALKLVLKDVNSETFNLL